MLALLLAIVMGALTLLSASALGASFLNWSRNLEPAVGQFLNPALIALAGVLLALGVLKRRGRSSRRKP